MPAVFETLPGLEVPVGGIAAGFKKLWADSPAQESRAVQLNLVLHLGANTTPADALAQFQHTLRFAQRYPARVVVLCPDFDEGSGAGMRAKIYGECFLGKSKNDTRCVEFVLLQYTMAVRAYLENQVSVCLSTDMPLYYWAHRFSETKRLADYDYLLTRSKRILFDSAVAPADTFTYPWPNLAAVRDLAYTRTLPLRQNLGQFLSRYTPSLINTGLRQVTLRHRQVLTAEACCLLGWVKKGLARSGATGVGFEVTGGDCPGCFAMDFTYTDPKKTFAWSADLSNDHAEFTGDLGTGPTKLEAGAHFLAPEMALSEAMFF
ncbi:MAG TPA: glucose-6-phosphate dehydrogenase assembly protein OpcA [Lacunisphaera sp.]|jgi:hypothetical protein|nr:glucose-6-phosphate dehydrogenase assembly protein OpcA [Lacunisphaera sp.]HQY06211.1 glucose-6-phosphate dehydrogenase assembly protein OpcA [Lacunisphaera sp.]